HHAARGPQVSVAEPERGQRVFGVGHLEEADGLPGRGGGEGPVSQSVHHAEQNAAGQWSRDVRVPGSAGLERVGGHGPLHASLRQAIHFFTVTVVPWPALVRISNSSIRRRTPGNPSPSRPEVE